ncbi:RNA methyltransferase, TrmH family, group 1 [Gloeothece citriformis PCC 7424]|uniref:tRNA (cytidine/uridine-2'-O-)-methyltransferase TrmJ n=1 Tax=Gloeothece citriformis (strain PCC 7424) TaxID=65393 RepID=B7KDD7_GLOC7|nr:RNA methyltransferase [Gloeothece citriformis]ACK68957.1 RNA methyltransferase, TrmH family, group 1 [Gloeothece citriformis PCC 7424]
MSQTPLEEIKIILVEPAGALNVGSVARVMKNMGLKRLILVNPRCDPFSDEAKRMAVHGQDILEQLQLVNSLPQALTGCQRAIATTSRMRTLPTVLETPRDALPWLLDSGVKGALIFGPEDRGLSNEELNYAQRFVCIPANPDYPSLNLAQAVAVCVYELYQATLTPVAKRKSEDESASLEDLERYYQDLETLLLKIGYLYPHTASARMEKFRRMYYKANLNREELAMLRGILRQMNWAMQHLAKIESHKNPEQ